MLKAIGGGVGCAIAAVILIVAASFGALYLNGTLDRVGRDINRENIQHSQGYVQTQTAVLMNLMTKYEDPDATAGQKQAIVNDFCVKVNNLIPEEWNQPITEFEAYHC